MENKIIARSKYDSYEEPGIKCTLEEKMTKQSFTDECDINKIIDRFARTGILPEQKQKQYGDFSNVADYQTSIMIVQQAHEQFMALDGKVRAKFNNDPSAFLAFAQDASNIDEMVKLGLATKSQESVESEAARAAKAVSEKEAAK